MQRPISLLLDRAALDDDDLRDDLEPINMLFSRATARHIRELIIAGRTIVRDGRVMGVDLPAIRDEVLSQMRSGVAKNGALISAMSALDQAIARHYLPNAPCC
jgi:hypothetical protein